MQELGIYKSNTGYTILVIAFHSDTFDYHTIKGHIIEPKVLTANIEFLLQFDHQPDSLAIVDGDKSDLNVNHINFTYVGGDSISESELKELENTIAATEKLKEPEFASINHSIADDLDEVRDLIANDDKYTSWLEVQYIRALSIECGCEHE